MPCSLCRSSRPAWPLPESGALCAACLGLLARWLLARGGHAEPHWDLSEREPPGEDIPLGPKTRAALQAAPTGSERQHRPGTFVHWLSDAEMSALLGRAAEQLAYAATAALAMGDHASERAPKALGLLFGEVGFERRWRGDLAALREALLPG